MNKRDNRSAKLALPKFFSNPKRSVTQVRERNINLIVSMHHVSTRFCLIKHVECCEIRTPERVLASCRCSVSLPLTAPCHSFDHVILTASHNLGQLLFSVPPSFFSQSLFAEPLGCSTFSICTIKMEKCCQLLWQQWNLEHGLWYQGHSI